MSGPARVLALPLDVPREEVLRQLGYPAGENGSARALACLDRVWQEARALLAPRGAYRLVDGATARAAGMPEVAEHVAVAACTIGDALEREAARRGEAGALLDALVLDAFGSAAAEAAADALNTRICTAAHRRGLHAAARVSPGYGSWDTSCQRQLLPLLPTARLGITLTPGAMMVPRKSVSFAVALPGEAPRFEGSPCARCGLLRCRHRVAPADCG